jgi:hypothetical protein
LILKIKSLDVFKTFETRFKAIKNCPNWTPFKLLERS